jgi:hypothetical protein
LELSRARTGDGPEVVKPYRLCHQNTGNLPGAARSIEVTFAAEGSGFVRSHSFAAAAGAGAVSPGRREEGEAAEEPACGFCSRFGSIGEILKEERSADFILEARNGLIARDLPHIPPQTCSGIEHRPSKNVHTWSLTGRTIQKCPYTVMIVS